MTVPAADNLRRGACPDGLPWTWGDPTSDHGHTDCWERHTAADLLDAIDALHQPYPEAKLDQYCVNDDHAWPCPTARLLHQGIRGASTE